MTGLCIIFDAQVRIIALRTLYKKAVHDYLG